MTSCSGSFRSSASCRGTQSMSRRSSGEDLVSGEELVADLSESPQGLAQADLRVRAIVDDLHAGRAEGPLVGGMKEVHFPTDHVDGLTLSRLPQLSEHGFLNVAGDLRLAPGVVLPGQAQLQSGDGQVVMAFVGVPIPAAASDDDGHVSQPLRVLIFEKSLSQFGHVVLAVRLQGPHELSCPSSHQDVIGSAVSDERLGLIELAVRGAPAGETEEELARAGELAIRAREEHGLQAVVPQRQELRALR